MATSRALDRHLSGIATRILLQHVRDRLGEAGVLELLHEANEDRPQDLLRDDTSWSSYWQFRPLLEVAGRLLADHGGLQGIAELRNLGTTTAPEIASIMHSFASPIESVSAGTSAAASLFPILICEPEIAGPTRLRWHRRLAEGFEPFAELCAFLNSLYSLSVRFYGLRIVELTEPSCQCRGDDGCVDEILWDESDDLALRLDFERTLRELSESRLEAYQQVVNDIVSAENVDTVLSRIVRHAARAMHGQGFILAVDALPGGTRLFTDGVSADEAEAVLDEGAGISVEIASAQRRYGRILALDPNASISFEKASLESYARLAATALDSAFALEEARRQAQTAEALLTLSTSLAEPSSVGELASKLASAIAEVIDCDCSAVLLLSEGVLRVAAHHGFRPSAAGYLDNFELPISSVKDDGLVLRQRDELVTQAQELVDVAGLTALARAPMTLDQETVGLLIAAVAHDTGRIFDDVKLADRFSGLAGQATLALRNARLLEQIRHQSLHDPLTDLPNRSLILDRAEHMLSRARRSHCSPAALFIDLDGFKEINDTLGHSAGDQLLQKVADRLKGAVRTNDTLGRLGGDEFVVLCEANSLDAGAEVVAERILEVFREPFELLGLERSVHMSASIGIAVGAREAADSLLHDADIALYRAKASGKRCYRVFSPEMKDEMTKGLPVGVEACS